MEYEFFTGKEFTRTRKRKYVARCYHYFYYGVNVSQFWQQTTFTARFVIHFRKRSKHYSQKNSIEAQLVSKSARITTWCKLVMETIVKKDGILFPFGNGCHLDVEYSGLEPLTSTLPVSRSSQMS